MHMKVLIVGAGAIGVSYGWILKRSGAQISFLIKPKHRANLESGIQVYEHQRRGKPTLHHRLDDFGILDDVSKIQDTKFDAVLLTVASPALSDSVWLKSLIQAIGKGPTLIALQPGLHDRDRILEAGLDPKQLVYGTIPILAYLAPMPGEKLPEPGIAFWIPPLAKSPWMGIDNARTKEVTEIFSRGGLPGFIQQEEKPGKVIGETLLRLLVAGLERSEWDFQKFSHGENIILVCDAAMETLPILAQDRKLPNPGEKLIAKIVFKPWFIRLAWRLFSSISPLDTESFFRVHFTKVEKQSHEGIDGIIDLGKRFRLPTTNLMLLRKKLPGKA